MCILGLSKTLMYDFHYNYIKTKYDGDTKLLFTDTDSLTYEIKTKDAYEDFFSARKLFNNSEYPENSPCFDKTNKKVIGKFKDETYGVPITEIVGLGSNMYSYMTDDMRNEKQPKVSKNQLYKDTLMNKKQTIHKMKTIQSDKHEIGTY